MQCSKCGTKNSTMARFCTECGNALGVPCTACGFGNPPEAKRCGGCGTALQAAPRAEAERRQLTVFFVDLVGSTAMSEAWDPEELREMYARYQTICADIIKRYDGHIAQYLGDGVLAYFGYPVAHEDDALRAVRSGLEILASLSDVTLGGEHPMARIGIHTGLVVVGDVGGGQKQEQLALGEAPNIAARVQGEAEPNTMLVSEATRRLVAGHFLLGDLGPRNLKGISRPIQLWRVLGMSDATSRFDAMASAAGLAPFVGRQVEMDVIREAWGLASHGEGQTLLVRGEAGIGKSRLLGAARNVASLGAHERFEAECSPYDSNSPLHPVVHMLERRLGFDAQMADTEKLDRIEEFVVQRGGRTGEAVPLLASLLSVNLSGRFPASDLPPAKQRQRMLQVLAELQLQAPGGAPTLVVIEDLHWADPSTLELVAALVSQQSKSRLMVIGSTRPELPELWSPAPNRRELKVEALARTDIRALVAGVAGPKPLPDSVLKEIVERTGGIPLFVEAVTRTVLESGVLTELEDRFELSGPLPPGLIPSTVHDSLMARIDRLGPDKVIAQVASVIGREFRSDLLSLVTGRSGASLEGALRQLIDLDLVSRTGIAPNWTYTFKHALLQDAAYGSLLKKTCRDYHGRIADALSEHFSELVETNPALLARHLEGAGRVKEAVPAWIKAGTDAGQRSAMQECVAYLKRAITLLETLPVDDPDRLANETVAQLAIAPPLMATAGWGAREVERACLRAKELCEQTGNGEGLFGAMWGLWTVLFVRGEHERALEAAKTVLSMAMAGDVGILHVAARHAIGFSHYYLGEFAEARMHAEKALEIFSLDQEKLLVSVFQIPSTVCCLSFLTQSLRFLGFPEQARERQLQLEQLVRDLDNPACTAVGLGVGQYHYFDRNDIDTIRAQADRGYTLAVEEGFLFWSAAMRVYRGWSQALTGESERGIREMDEGLEDVFRTNSGIFVPQWRMMMAQGRRVQGDLPGALKQINLSLELIDTFRERYYLSESLRERAAIHVAMGDTTKAEDDLRRAIGVAHQQDARLLELRSAVALSNLLIARERPAEVRDLLTPLLGSFTEGFDEPDLVQARELLASLG